jgi:serine/arginine repetitive matrix protein 2
MNVMEAEPSSSAAEKRAVAVAKLRRAASLPRMKDGRRPPMHVDGVSEGEKTPAEGSDGPSISDVKAEQFMEASQETEDKKEDPAETSDTAEVTETLELNEPPEVAETPEPSRVTMTTPEPAVRTKRRSRSRSRSRGSKDFKGKARATQSPTPSPLVQGTDSSPEDSPPPPPSISIPPSPNLISPIPSHYGEMQASRLLMSPRLMSPDSNLLYPGTSPPTPSPMTPMLPTLEALQRGLFRSNSAAARMMAMHKLTGGTDTYEHPSPSPTPPPGVSPVGRSNTVSGGERSAARKMMLRRLGERIKEEHGDQTSGGEETFTPPSPSPKRRRRRSRRGSTGASNTLDESDHPSTGANTPVIPPAPLPSTFDSLILKTDPIPRVPSSTPSRTASAQEHAHQRETTLLKLTGGDQSSDYEPPRKRRSVVVEEEDDISEDNPAPLPSTLGSPATPERPGQMTSRVPRSSVAEPIDTASGAPVVGYLSIARSSAHPNSLSSGPFRTPLKEEKPSRDEDEEQVLYQAENHRARSPYHDAFDRAISWVADPGQF